jgi:hypothetical protein
LVVMIPALEAGNYILEVVTQYSSGHNIIKNAHSSQFDQVLIVE